jgi:hypothetical protein
VEDVIIMRALEPEVADTIWRALQPRLPTPIESHPLGVTGRGCRIVCASAGS